MSVEPKTVDGVPFARKYFENNERYIEALIVIKEDGTQDLVETERLIDEYYYNDPEDEGDGIDWHVDGSIYLGQRWAGILVLIEDTREDFAKLELQPNLVTTTLPKSNMVNALVLFQGDHVRHRVRPLVDGEERIVLSLLFSDWPQRTRNILLLRYQSRVNQAFYKNPNP